MNKPKYMLIISWLMVIIICASSCKPTPKEAVIVNKANGALENAIAASPEPLGKYQAPAHWTDIAQSDSGSIKIEIDADVTVPDVQAYPVLRISPADITQELADKMINACMQGKPVYQPKGPEEYTKQELNDLIVALKKHITEEIEPLRKTDPATYASAIASDNEQLQRYEELLKTAPDVYVYKPSNGKFTSPDTANHQVSPGENLQANRNYLNTLQSINVVANLGKEKYASLKILKNTSNKNNTVRFNNSENIIEAEWSVEINDNLPNQKISLQDALAKAKNFITQLGIDYLHPVLLASKPYMLSPDKMDYSKPIDDAPRYYVFVFTRVAGGVPTAYVDNSFFNFAKEQYFEDWPEELAVVSIDDTGIIAFKWVSPSKIIKTENSNVSLLTFNEIQDKLKQQLIISGVWRDEDGVISRTIHINKITLGMARIQAKNSDSEYLFVPVWDFFGYSTIQYKEGSGDPANMDENNVKTEDNLGHSYLTINAIDGSIVYR